MLFVLCQIGVNRYALPASQVVEVLPLVRLMPLPQLAQGVAGVFNYRGQPVPVFDLSQFILGQPAQARVSTRIVLTRQEVSPGSSRTVGFLAEHATTTFRCDPGVLVPQALVSATRPWLGPVFTDAEGMVQTLDLNRLLPDQALDPAALPIAGKEGKWL